MKTVLPTNKFIGEIHIIYWITLVHIYIYIYIYIILYIYIYIYIKFEIHLFNQRALGGVVSYAFGWNNVGGYRVFQHNTSLRQFDPIFRMIISQCVTHKSKHMQLNWLISSFANICLGFCALDWLLLLPTILQSLGCPRGEMVKVINCGIVVREFVLQTRYYVHFRANTLGKVWTPLFSLQL